LLRRIGNEKNWNSRKGNEIYVPRLGGIGQAVGEYIENQGFESPVTVFGHLQRGETPTSFDRSLVTRYGAAAVRLAAQGGVDRMIALRCVVEGSSIFYYKDATTIPKRVKLDDGAVITARNVGISFGG
jgi:6-phosphofructokinase 1